MLPILENTTGFKDQAERKYTETKTAIQKMQEISRSWNARALHKMQKTVAIYIELIAVSTSVI